MDLHAILNGSDSESDDVPSYKATDMDSQVDLEQILRDDTEDDDEDRKMRYAAWETQSNDNFDEISSKSMNSRAHTADEWDVLRTILNDDEEDDEEEDNDDDRVISGYPSRLTRENVNAILQSDDDDDNDDYGDNSTIATNFPSISNFTSSQQNSPDLTGQKRLSNEFDKGGIKQTSPPTGKMNEMDAFMPALMDDKHSTIMDEATETEASRRSLQNAQTYEKKLLRSGHRDIVSPLTVKRRMKPKIELTSRAKRKKDVLPERFASRFNFSGIVEQKTMPDISSSIEKHADMKAKVPTGLPTSLAFNSKFIGIGTQLGIILVYDLFEVLRQRLGGSGFAENWSARVAGSVTSLDFNYNGEMVIAGYTSGIVVLWDTIRGVVLRSINDLHPSPITSVRFLDELKVVTIDAGGLVNKLSFVKNILWSNYSMETECLLDGTAGQILASSVLSPYHSVNTNIRPRAFESIFSRISLIALSSERSSFVVAVDPQVSVLHRWARPPNDRTEPMNESPELLMDQQYLPCLSWAWALISGANNVVMPTLARSWGCCLQMLRANFPALEEDQLGTKTDNSVFHWPAFGVHDEVDVSAPIVALEWMNERTVVYLTVTNEFTLLDTVMTTLLERLDFSGLKLVYAEFSLSRSLIKDDEEKNGSDPILCAAFQNSIRCSDDRLMVLCQRDLKCISIVSAKRRISSLEEDGEWLEALALALDYYESTVLSQEDRKRDPSGRKDLAKHPEFSKPLRGDDDEWIAKLLIRYLNLAVDNAPDHFVAGTSSGSGQTKIDLASSHFQMLAGVCVEFCIVTRRLDLLYGPIFQRFSACGYTSVFLDVLEPYILSDKLVYVAPQQMAYFVEHCKASNGIATVERCLLHMDCTIMDFDSILSLLRVNEMYTALFFVFNQGLNDFVTPLEIILERLFDEADAGHLLALRRKDGIPQNEFERLGYKALLYLQCCFQGKTFPHEHEILPESQQQQLKGELLSFLVKEEYSPSTHAKKTSDRMFTIGQRAQRYPYLRILLQLDPHAMLDTLRITIDDSNIIGSLEAPSSSDDWTRSGDSKGVEPPRIPSKQELADVLFSITLPQLCDSSPNQEPLVKSRAAVNAFLDFAAEYVVSGSIQLDKQVTFMIIARLADRYTSSKAVEVRKKSQKQIMDLLSASRSGSYEPDAVLDLLDRAKMHRAALLLHQQVASFWLEAGNDNLSLRSSHFCSAIDCYLKDDDMKFRRDVFDYIRKECSGVNGHNEVGKPPGKTLKDALYAKLPDLVVLDALQTSRLVAELFADDLDSVVSSLEIEDGGTAQYLFFEAVNSGELAHIDPTAKSVLKLSMDQHYKYLALMSKLHPEKVYEYLSTHDNYRSADALKLCQQHNIADASAYLLERMGNVSSALQLILQTLEGRLMNLKRTVRGMDIDSTNGGKTLKQGKAKHSDDQNVKAKQEADGVRRILIVALDLCERNSAGKRAEHGSQLWFNVLDRLINAKGFLRLNKERTEHATIIGDILRELLRLTMQRMVSKVALPDLVRKVTSDHAGTSLGDLREMFESLLGTYSFELSVFENATQLYRQDLHEMQSMQRDIQKSASLVKSIRNIPLETGKSKNPLDRMLLKEGILSVTKSGNAVLTAMEGSQYAQQAERGLASTLMRLRVRRKVGNTPGIQSRSTSLSMRTESDLLFLGGELEPAVYGDRPVGVLGDAEHRGRLLTLK